MWKTRKYACVWRIANQGSCLHRSLAIVYFVISNLLQDLSVIGLVPCHLTAAAAQPSDVVHMKAGPPLSQGAINRGEKPQALRVMRLNQTSLSSQCFIELQFRAFSFHSVFQYI